MNPLHEHLVAQVEGALQTGVAVIVDPAGDFIDFIQDITHHVEWSDEHPDVCLLELGGRRVRFARFEGSWFGLKGALEPFLAGDGRPDPPLLAYVPRPLPFKKHDVLTELVLAGRRLTWILDDEARTCLRQQFTDGVIDGVLDGGTATYEDVVRFLTQNTRTASKLKALLPNRSDTDILLAWLADPALDEAVAGKGAEGELLRLVESRLGLELDDGVELPAARAQAARFVLVAEFCHDLQADRPDALSMYPAPSSDAQRDEALELARRLRTGHGDAYVDLADRAAAELRLDRAGIDPATLGSIDTFRFEERLLLGWCAELLATRRYGEALEIARARTTSFWVQRRVERQAQWELCRRVGELGLRLGEVSRQLPGKGGSPTDWVRAYAAEDGWHRIDGAQRALETFRAQMVDEAACEQAAALALRAHDRLLQEMAERFTAALGAAGWTVPELLHQTRVHPDVVETRGGPVAFVQVDAMRYEMGVELTRLLDGVEDLHLQPAVAALPSITPVGMAALLPGAATDFSVDEQGGRLVAVVDDNPVGSSKERENHVRARVPDSSFVKLEQVLLWPPSKLKAKIAASSLVVVTSQGIDLYGEMGDDFGARRAMAEILGDLSRAVRRLARAGIEHFVVTADHGHLFGLRKGDDMKTAAPGGQTVELHRRCWIGRGGSTPPGTVRVTAGQLGYRSDLDFVFPRGLGVLKAGGDLSFHHGGTSLQELVVPVLSFRVPPAAGEAGPAGVEVRLTGLPDAVTNTFFQLGLEVVGEDLFCAGDVPVRVVLLSGQEQVGHVGMVDIPGFDPLSGVVRLAPGARAQLVMRLTREDATEVRVVALDPDSAAVLARSPSLPVQLLR